MKKRVALLAMAAMLALTPMASFAATSNGITKVAKVAEDAELENNVPTLNIENDDNHMEDKDTFILELENAEWLESDHDAGELTGTTLEEKVAESVYKSLGTGATDAAKIADGEALFTKFVVDRSTDKKLQIEYQLAGAASTLNGKIFAVPMYTELQGEGSAKVTVNSKSGVLTEDSHTFATGADGDVTVELDDTITFSNSDTIPTLTISENIAGAIDVSDLKRDEYITLTVDDDFNLDITNAYVSGDFVGGKVLLSASNAELDDNELKIYFQGTGGGNLPSGISTPIAFSTDDSVRRDFDIVGIGITAGSKADEGDLDLKIKSSISEIEGQTFELGKFAEYDVTVEADGDPTEIYVGKYDESDDDVHELQTLLIEEEVTGALSQDRYVNVEFPSGVRIMKVDIDGTVINWNDAGSKIDENEFEFMPSTHTTLGDDVDMEVTFYVTVEPGFTGDITATVEGRAFDDEDYKVVLGKALAPVKVEAEVEPLKAGVRKQELGKITITETAEEVLEEGKWVILELSDDDMEWDDEPTIKVVKGDLEIDEDSIIIDPKGTDVGLLDTDDLGEHVIAFQIDEESSEASVIEITNAEVKLDRSIAEGAIEVEVKGNALVQNYDEADNNDAKFDEDTYVTLEVANVITPADDDTKAAAEAKFVIGQAEFMVGEDVVVADVAPYIKDGRTMLSLSFVAKALGVESNNIMWDGESRTVTIFKGDRIAQVQIGSNKLMVNGTPVMMDTAAEIKEGRTMLPVAYVAKALGAEVAWDGATKTVTIK